jgi:hypothetical protein
LVVNRSAARFIATTASARRSVTVCAVSTYGNATYGSGTYGDPLHLLRPADSPEKLAAGYGVVLSSMLAGGWIADVAMGHHHGYTVIGALAGAYAGVRIWNRYTDTGA